MLTDAGIDDIVASKAITGINANWLGPSLAAAGYTDAQLAHAAKIDFSALNSSAGDDHKAWKHVWSAGHGAGESRKIERLEEIVQNLAAEYRAARLLHRVAAS